MPEITTNLDTGKHWTIAEKTSRQAALGAVKRRRVTLKPPAWLSDAALITWKDVTKKLKGIELLDNLDTELLAIYCDACANYRKASKVLSMDVVDADGNPVSDTELIKAAQAWARIVTVYAEKLGLTPSGRARLAKKKAERVIDTFEDVFGGR